MRIWWPQSVLGIRTITTRLFAAVRRDFLSDDVGSVVEVRAFNAGSDIVTDSLVNQTLLVGLVGLAAGVAGVVWLLVGRANTRA